MHRVHRNLELIHENKEFIKPEDYQKLISNNAIILKMLENSAYVEGEHLPTDHEMTDSDWHSSENESEMSEHSSDDSEY
jgi:hypothetical protein